MTKLSDLHTPEFRAKLEQAWPFPVAPDLVLDGERPEQVIRIPVFDVGQRVIVAPTPGAPDPAMRKGGPGTVAYTREFSTPGRPRSETMVYVLVDGATSPTPEPFHPCEVQAEPTV